MKNKREIYRQLTTTAEARAAIARRFGARRCATETVPVRDALGRVLARPVKARRSVPSFHAAAMDGLAVRAADTFGAMAERPVILPEGPWASYVNTGEPMPEDVVGRIRASLTFNQGFATVEYLSGALYDMKIHVADPAGLDPRRFEQQLLEELGMPREIVSKRSWSVGTRSQVETSRYFPATKSRGLG